MPPVVAALVAMGLTTVGAYVVIATVVISAGTAIYGAAQARKAERLARNGTNDAMKDRMVTRIATEAPHRYIYGRAKVGADIVAMFTSGTHDQFKHLVCVHAVHECDAIETVYINNKPVGDLDGNGFAIQGYFTNPPDRATEEEKLTGPNIAIRWRPLPGTVKVFSGSGANMVPVTITVSNDETGVYTVAFSGPVTVVYERPKWGELDASYRGGSAENEFSSSVRVQRHLGTPGDTVDTYLQSVVGASKWPSTAVLSGMCYTVITLDLNHAEFQGGLVPIHAVIRGKKLYDPRDGQTRWSQNPALAIMDYLTSPLCGVPMADLPTAQFITAANVCDEASPTGGTRYTLNGTVTSDQGQAAVLESMTQAMAGGMVATTWDVYAGKYVAPVAALTQEDIVGSLSVTPGVSDASVYNGVKGQYIGPENNHVQTDFKPYQNAVYRENDGRDLYTNIDFPFTDSLQRVTNLARIFTEDQRNGFTIKAEFSLKAWPLKVGQRVTFTSPFLGQAAKVYRITDKSYAPNSAVQLSLKEDDASIWDYADATVVDSTPNSDLPNPWKIDPLASLSCSSGEAALLRQADGTTVPRILAAWPATAQANGVQIEVEWRAVSSTTWERTTVSASETRAYLSPITPGFFYLARARVVNPSLNVRSLWIGTVYQVEVFTARPTVYMWAADKPATPAGAAIYTWATGLFGSAPAGWSLIEPTAPAGGDVTLWAAMVPLSDVTDVTSSFDWAMADVSSIGYAPTSAGTGPAGYSNARVFAYQRKATAPVGTPGAVNYDFATGTITTATLLNGWQKTIPAADGNPLYVTSASASAAGTTDTIATGEWSGAVVLMYDGGAGTPGFNSATITLYQRTGSAASPAKPSASVTYTFASGAVAGLNNGWNTFIPTTGGAYLHTTFAVAIATTATDSIPATEWAAVQLMYDATDLIAAKAAADAANTAITDMARDDLLSPAEKSAENLRWNTITGERAGIDAAAAALGITTERTAFTNAYNTLSAYITGLGASFTTIPGTAVSIAGSTYRANFKNYYDTKQALLNAISAKSATAPLLVIGGRNLYRKTQSFLPLVNNTSLSARLPSGFQFLVNSATPGGMRLLNVIPGNGEYTISFDLYGNSPGSYPVQIDLCDGTVWTINITNQVQHFEKTFVVSNWSAGTYNFIDFAGLSFQYHEFTNFMVERGNKATAWSPAPEDVAEDTAAASLTANWPNISGTGKPEDGATKGAPAGTLVAGVDADTVAAGAQAGAKLNVAFTVEAGGDLTTELTNGGVRTLGTWTAVVTGGTAPYQYVWSEVAGAGFQLSNATTQTVTVKAGGFSQVRNGELALTVKDSQGRSAYDKLFLNVTFSG